MEEFFGIHDVFFLFNNNILYFLSDRDSYNILRSIGQKSISLSIFMKYKNNVNIRIIFSLSVYVKIFRFVINLIYLYY